MVQYLYFTKVRQFQSIGRISLPYCTISDFLRSKQNSSMDGQNFAGAYKMHKVSKQSLHGGQ